MCLILLYYMCHLTNLLDSELENNEWTEVPAAAGIQSHHVWFASSSSVTMARHANHTGQAVFFPVCSHVKSFHVGDFSQNEFIACVYDDNWWIGMVTDVHFEEGMSDEDLC